MPVLLQQQISNIGKALFVLSSVGDSILNPYSYSSVLCRRALNMFAAAKVIKSRISLAQQFALTVL